MKRVIKVVHKTSFLVLEGVGVLLLLGAGASGFLMWKFSQGPVDITFAAERVREALVTESAANDLKFNSIVAEWPDFTGPISIGLSGVELVENGRTELRIKKMGVRIAKLPLLLGLIKPQAVIVDSPELNLVRLKDGSLHLFLAQPDKADAATEVLPTSVTDINQSIKAFGESFFLGSNLPDYPELDPISDIERISVSNAQISVVDRVHDKTWVVPRMDFELTRQPNQFDMAFHYTAENATPSSLTVGLSRDDNQSATTLRATVKDVNLATWTDLFFPQSRLQENGLMIDGTVTGTLTSDWLPQTLNLDLTSDQGTVTLNNVYNVPLTFGSIAAHAEFDRAAGTLVLKDTFITMNNRKIGLSGERKLDDTSSIYPVNITLPELTFDELKTMWPEAAKNTQLADWLTVRMSKGTVHNFRIMVPVDLSNPDLVDVTKLDAALDYEHLDVDYLSPMIPVTDAKGSVTLKDDTLTVKVDSGKVDNLTMTSGQVVATHLAHTTIIGDVLIDTTLHGPLGTYIEFISRDPIALGKTVGFKSSEVKGVADVTAKVSFPGSKDVPMEQVKVAVSGEIRDGFLPKVTKGLNLSGGPFAIKVDDTQFTVSGSGLLDKTPVTLDYAAFLDLASAPYVSRVKAKLIADQSLRQSFGVDLDQFVTGAVPVEVDYREEKNGSESIDVSADLTPVTIMLDPLGYKKGPGKAGRATCHVETKNGEVAQIKDLDVNIVGQGGLKGNLQFGKVGKAVDVASGNFQRVTIGGHNDFALIFKQPSPQNYVINITGKKFDARRYTAHKPAVNDDVKVSNEGSNEIVPRIPSPAVNATITVDQLKTGDLADQSLSKAKLMVSTNPNDDITALDLAGNLSNGQFTMSLKPNAEGKMVLSAKSDNAGEALRTMDIFNDMVGGKLEMSGTQRGSGINDIQGSMRITDFSIVRAPALAKLINLFSLSGLSELLQNKGITFEKMRSDFTWIKRGEQRDIYLRDGKMTGASLGLTFGGVVHQSEAKMDLSGTFVPMSKINGFVNMIPLIGDLLTGGKNGGIIAATYAVKGESSNPSVTVNPLSVLTPGFLRTLFFEGNSGFMGDKSDTPHEKPKRKTYNN